MDTSEYFKICFVEGLASVSRKVHSQKFRVSPQKKQDTQFSAAAVEDTNRAYCRALPL